MGKYSRANIESELYDVFKKMCWNNDLTVTGELNKIVAKYVEDNA